MGSYLDTDIDPLKLTGVLPLFPGQIYCFFDSLFLSLS